MNLIKFLPVLSLVTTQVVFCTYANGSPQDQVDSKSRFNLHLRQGMTLVREIDSNLLKWRDSATNQIEEISWDKIEELDLIIEPAGEQMDSINLFLAQLSDKQYSVREMAEQQLSDPRVSGAFRQAIENRLEVTDDVETTYRIRRILEILSENVTPSDSQFDKLVLKDGTDATGEAVDFEVKIDVFDKTRTLERKELRKIRRRKNETISGQANRFDTQVFNDHQNNFYKVGDTIVSFEPEDSTKFVSIGEKIDGNYSDAGVLMKTERSGYIRLFKYSFNRCPIDSGERCACPFDEMTGKPLRGNTVITFCEPGQPERPAGVKKFGVFLERIDHSRDFVVEAYNAVGQMIGMVEASDQLCIFAGFTSSDPITKIRIARNENLEILERDIDQNYAFDCLTFDRPQAMTVSQLNSSYPFAVQLRNGDYLGTRKMDFTKNRIEFQSLLDGEAVRTDWSEVQTVVRNGVYSSREAKDSLFGELTDGSIVRLESPQEAFDFIGKAIDANQIVGYWQGRCRLPVATDFNANRPLLVFPSCRILAGEFKSTHQEVSWNGDQSQKRVQDVQLVDREDDFVDVEEPDPDLTPQFNQVEIGNPLFPSVWKSRPNIRDLNRPHLQLNDGQYFVLGEGGQFEVIEINDRQRYIELRWGQLSKRYPLQRVLSLSLPKPNGQK